MQQNKIALCKMSLLYLKLGITFQILTPSAMSTALAVWPGVYCLMGLYSSISFQYWTTNHPGKQTFAISFFFSSCSYIFPFVKLASCALMISSKSAFIPFKLCFFLAFTLSSDFFVYSSFYSFPSFFIWPCSGRWCSRKHIR